jgi:hypothetical protein
MGPTMPNPSVAVKAEADDEREGKADLSCRAGLADGEPLAEVVQADPDRDQKRQLMSCGKTVDPRP